MTCIGSLGLDCTDFLCYLCARASRPHEARPRRVERGRVVLEHGRVVVVCERGHTDDDTAMLSYDARSSATMTRPRAHERRSRAHAR